MGWPAWASRARYELSSSAVSRLLRTRISPKRPDAELMQTSRRSARVVDRGEDELETPGSHDHPEDLFQGRDALADLVQAVRPEGVHPLQDGLLPDLLGAAVLDGQLLDLLRHLHHLVE